MFSSFHVLKTDLRSGGKKALTNLNKLAAKGCRFKYVGPFLLPGLKGGRHFPRCYKILDNFIEIWIKFGFEEKNEKGSPYPGILPRKLH